ncbi:MAG TPA: GAF domain-containing protein [Ktedonobacteraceae bacterium]|nr:GAF domain-containing protein [Ktedonobacteraceae bacterium]
MQKVSSWRDLLQSLLSNPAERDRIAAAIGVRSITLSRWAQGDTVPRLANLQQLLYALPVPYQAQFRSLLEQDGLLHADSLKEDMTPLQEIPFSFVREVFETRATTSDAMRFWAISHQVLQHALRQLDPVPVGMSINVVRCMPPSSDGSIRTLHESIGRGTSPWKAELEQPMFLGAESLSGYVVMSGRSATIHNLKAERHYYPASLVEHEISAVAVPLMDANRVAGCLLFSSTQPEYFISQLRIALVQGYGYLMSMAFAAEDFYPQELIQLQVMPSFAVQQQYFASFRQRVVKVMQDAVHAGHPLPLQQAEQVVWQQLEEILLKLPLSSDGGL